MAEAKAAGEALGVHLRTLLHLPNRRLFDSFEARVKLAIEFRKHRPRLVIGLGDKTPMASPDHWQAMQITDAAIFYSRLTKWDDQFDNLPPHIIGPATRAKLDEGINLLDGIIQTAASQHGFVFGDVRSIFVGHQLCSGSDWLHALNIFDISESYHPTADGQSKGYLPVFTSSAG